MGQITLNRLPVKTWNWLKMNEAAVDLNLAGSDPAADISSDVPEAGEFQAMMKSVIKEEIPTGMGEEFCKVIEDAGATVRSYELKANGRTATPLSLYFNYHNGQTAADITELIVGDEASMTVIMGANADADAKVRAAWRTKIVLGKKAKLKLVHIQTLNSQSDFFNDIGCIAGEGSTFELIQVILDGSNTYYGCRSELIGDKSRMDAQIAYMVSKDGTLDMNYIANHFGRKTESAMNVSGVLSDRGRKIFRGTIDFKNGAKGAVGNEKEDVLLLNEGVSNQTIPLILCAEEDVVGNHGATIGRLDEELLFYLESRGIDLDAIMSMMARAKVDAVAGRIGDEAAQKMISDFLTRG